MQLHEYCVRGGQLAISPGTRFGHYEIGESIGAGGMGEVYRATDPTLERDVAIKVLPASFAKDADRVSRFEREAKTLAALNHPNIAQIFGLEKGDETTALIMELVEGSTLEDRIAQGPIPADEALGIAMQIAEALEAAHSQNIVHRDLKPANVKVRDDGAVKVLDFGIAKALAPENLTSGPQSPIMTTPATQVGVILGTAAYMSPEQAKGKAVDQRTDIWAFGCVLYEMLTGQLAFGAEDVPTTLARVIANDADLDSLPAPVPTAVRQTIELCFQKDVRQRVADIRDVKLALAGRFVPKSNAPDPGSVEPFAVWRRAVSIASIALLVGVVISGLAVWRMMKSEPPIVSRFVYELPSGEGLRRVGRSTVSMAPDGSAFIYNADDGVYLRRLDELEARLIPETEEDLSSPFFSPDSQSVAYWAATRQLKRLALGGGAPVVIASDIANVQGASWAHDDTILFGQGDGIYRVSAAGGTPERVIPKDQDGTDIYGPQLLPDGDAVLFALTQEGNWDAGQIFVQSLATGERKLLVDGGSDARYVSTGHLVYAFEDGLFAIALDPEGLTVSGGPVSLVQGVARASAGQTGVAHYGVSENGTLVAMRGLGQGNREPVWVDHRGGEERTHAGPRFYRQIALSPQGDRVAMTIRENNEGDLWVYDLGRGVLTRLTFDSTDEWHPTWTPDGSRIAYMTSGSIAWTAADGTGQPEILHAGDGSFFPDSFTPDGRQLIFETSGSAGWDLHVLNLDEEQDTRSLVVFEGNQEFARISPDGRWIAYQSNETGRSEIFVRPFPEVERGKWQISRDGGQNVRWSPDSRTIYFRAQGWLYSVAVETEPLFEPGAPTEFLSTDYIPAQFTYDVHPDGERFLILKEGRGLAEDGRPEFLVVQNWFEEIQRLAPTN